MEKDRRKEKLKSAITQRDKAAITNMPLHGQVQTHLHSDHIDRKTSLLWLKDGILRLLTHVRLVRQNVLILSEVSLYMERSKNLEKKYVITVQKIHLPKGV